MAEGFFGRWSQRKLAERQNRAQHESAAQAQSATVAPAASLPVQNPTHPVAAQPDDGTANTELARRPPAAPPMPTMQDVAALHNDSDFTPFVARAVQPEVRNAALKKMFSDPHFNVMDGLDTYIDDYSVPDPLPVAMLRQMASAHALRLFDDADPAQPAQARADGPAGAGEAPQVADHAAPVAVAQLTPDPETGATSTHDDDTDLRLQPDDAAGPARPGRCIE